MSIIRFDARKIFEELPDFQLNNIYFFYKKRSSRNSKNRCLCYLILADTSDLQFFNFDLAKGSKVYADRANNHYVIEDVLKEAEIIFQPMQRKNSKPRFPPWICYLQHAYWKIVETSGSLLNQLFLKRIHAVTAQGFELKIVLFVLALSFQFFNLQLR